MSYNKKQIQAKKVIKERLKTLTEFYLLSPIFNQDVTFVNAFKALTTLQNVNVYLGDNEIKDYAFYLHTKNKIELSYFNQFEQYKRIEEGYICKINIPEIFHYSRDAFIAGTFTEMFTDEHLKLLKITEKTSPYVYGVVKLTDFAKNFHFEALTVLGYIERRFWTEDEIKEFKSKITQARLKPQYHTICLTSNIKD